jgi:hypothetical protein
MADSGVGHTSDAARHTVALDVGEEATQRA